MATDYEVGRKVKEELRSRDCTCGRNYADVGDLIDTVTKLFPDEPRHALDPQIRRLLQGPDYKRNYKGDVSLNEPECGTG